MSRAADFKLFLFCFGTSQSLGLTVLSVSLCQRDRELWRPIPLNQLSCGSQHGRKMPHSGTSWPQDINTDVCCLRQLDLGGFDSRIAVQIINASSATLTNVRVAFDSPDMVTHGEIQPVPSEWQLANSLANMGSRCWGRLNDPFCSDLRTLRLVNSGSQLATDLLQQSTRLTTRHLQQSIAHLGWLALSNSAIEPLGSLPLFTSDSHFLTIKTGREEKANCAVHSRPERHQCCPIPNGHSSAASFTCWFRIGDSRGIRSNWRTYIPFSNPTITR